MSTPEDSLPEEALPLDTPAEAAGGDDPFDTPARVMPDPDDLIVRLDGYEGPLDMLLDLARRQKVDLRYISVHALVEQYLAFVAEAREQNLELAADYLVMASWLTYLKSRLLLPTPAKADDEPTADELSARLAFQLMRLDAMRTAAEALTELPQLGRDVFRRGERGLRTATSTEWHANLVDLLKAYGRQRVAAIEPVLHRPTPKVMPLEAARARLTAILGDIPDWCLLSTLDSRVRGEDDDDEDGVPPRSVIASHFSAALEHAKAGRLELRQSGAFAPLYIRAAVATDTEGTPHE